MEVMQSTLFTFTIIAKGQGFSFGIQNKSREDAVVDLLEKLELCAKELRASLNETKGRSAS